MKKEILLLLVLLVVSVAYGQKMATIKGSVITEDMRLAANINVLLKGTSYGAATNQKGEFEFQAPEGSYQMLVSSLIFDDVEKSVNIKSNAINHFEAIRLIESMTGLNEVVVTGTRTEKRLSETPVQTMVVSHREMKKSGSVSLMESLQDNIPGLVVSPNAMGNNMRIKGLNTRYILVLVDGERLVSEGAGGNINFDQIDVDNIKRIEVVNGASSALYGSNAVGAVINIITKEPMHNFEGGTNVLTQSYNTWKSKVHAGVKKGKISARVSAFRNSSDGFGGTNGIPYAAKYQDYGTQLKFKYKPSKLFDVNLNGRFFQHETFHPEGTRDVTHPKRHTLTAGGKLGYHTRDKRYHLSLSSNFDKFFDFNVLEKRDDDLRKQNTSTYISNRLLNTFMLNEKLEFVGGLEHNHMEMYALKTLGTQPTTKKMDDMSAFFQADYKPIDKLDIVAGMRYTYNDKYSSAFTPKLSLMYQWEHFKFRAGAGTAFRAPTIKEMYYDFDHQGMFWIYGNPNLKAEKGLYNSTSLEYTDSKINASISFYHNRIRNKISQYDVTNGINNRHEKHYTNVSSATLQGVDFNISYNIIDQLNLKANYSFCDAKDDATGLEIEGNIKHSGTFAATWNGRVSDSPFSLQLAGRINSPQIYQLIELDAAGKEQVVTQKSEVLSIWKLTWVKPYFIDKHKIELTVKIDNLFNVQNNLTVNPGRQYLIGVKYAFK